MWQVDYFCIPPDWWGIAATSGLELTNPNFLALLVFTSIYTALWVMNGFPSYNPFLVARLTKTRQLRREVSKKAV